MVCRYLAKRATFNNNSARVKQRGMNVTKATKVRGIRKKNYGAGEVRLLAQPLQFTFDHSPPLRVAEKQVTSFILTF